MYLYRCLGFWRCKKVMLHLPGFYRSRVQSQVRYTTLSALPRRALEATTLSGISAEHVEL